MTESSTNETTEKSKIYADDHVVPSDVFRKIICWGIAGSQRIVIRNWRGT